MSDTPKTDAAWDKYTSPPYTYAAGDLRILAQQLERERDEAFELLASEKITRDHIIEKGGAIEKERDKAREELENVKLQLRLWEDGNIICEETLGEIRLLEDQIKNALLEQDEAREENAKLRDIAERAINYLDQSYRDGFSDEASDLRYELAQLKEGAK